MLEKKVELLSENMELLREVKGMGKGMSKAAIALLHTINDKKVDVNKTKELMKVLRDEPGVFSNMRGLNHITVAGYMSLENDPKNSLTEVININKKLKKLFSSAKFSPYLPVASILIYEYKGKSDVDSIIDRVKKAYNIMKANHKFLTKGDDVCDAVIIAMTFNDLDSKFIEVEQIYERLSKSGILKSNSLQALSHMIALGSESVDVKCDKVLKLNATIFNNKLKMGSYSMPLLAILALICDNQDELAIKLKETDEQVKKIKWFRSIYVSSYFRKMISATIVADYYARNDKKGRKEELFGMTNIGGISLVSAVQIASITAVINAATTNMLVNSRSTIY